MAKQEYKGPVALSGSKYASPDQWDPSQPNFKSDLIRNMDLIASASRARPMNPDAQLAVAQSQALKDEVEQHAKDYRTSVSAAIGNIHRTLIQLRESLTEQGHSTKDGLAAIDKMWKDLEQLFHTTKIAQSVLPVFMNKQKENISLYHSSMMNEALQNSHAELALQQKKVNVQHSLIIEHQQAFLDYKTQTEGKIDKFKKISDEASRLRLEKGLLKTELEKYAVELEEARDNKVNDEKLASELAKQLETVQRAKASLQNEFDEHHATVVEIQARAEKEKQQLDAARSRDIMAVKAKLDDALNTNTGLEELVQKLKADQQNLQKDKNRLKNEYQTAKGKYENQVAEFSKIFKQLGEETRQRAEAEEKVVHLQQELSQLQDQLGQASVGDVKKQEQIGSLSAFKSSLEGEIKKLKAELPTIQGKLAQSIGENSILKNNSKKLEREKDELEEEVNDLSSQVATLKKSAGGSSVLQEDNKKLQNRVKELQKAVAQGSAMSESDTVKTLQNKLLAKEAAETDLQNVISEWEEMAMDSYKRYKNLKETFGDICEKQDLDVRQVLDELASRTSGAVMTEEQIEDAKFWKAKYEAAIARF